VISRLAAQLAGRSCNVYTSDVRVRVRVRVRVAATGLDTYPDLSVVCGEEQRASEDRNALVNPIVIVEILSPSTEEYDRGEKLSHYQQIPSLREVVLVSHREPVVEVWRRDAGAWRQHTTAAGGVVALDSVGCTLAVDELYRDPLRRG
jgi:Uma2 family endonuclease